MIYRCFGSEILGLMLPMSVEAVFVGGEHHKRVGLFRNAFLESVWG